LNDKIVLNDELQTSIFRQVINQMGNLDLLLEYVSFVEKQYEGRIIEII
jgi:hypothetical protein